MPTSILPTAIESAMDVRDCTDDAQARLTVCTDVETGKPTWAAAMRATLEPPSGVRTVPIEMSWICEGEREGL